MNNDDRDGVDDTAATTVAAADDLVDRDGVAATAAADDLVDRDGVDNIYLSNNCDLKSLCKCLNNFNRPTIRKLTLNLLNQGRVFQRFSRKV